jgi:hypothetical protein
LLLAGAGGLGGYSGFVNNGMKILEVITPRMMNRAGAPLLRTTDRQIDQANAAKTQIIVVMPPGDFLSLAAPLKNRDDFRRDAQPLRDYNKWAKDGESTVMPFLRIDLAADGSGQVKAHEGRHRAAAILNAGGEWMRVGIQLRGYDGYESNIARAELAQYGHHRNNSEYTLSHADLPNRVTNQYNRYWDVDTRNWRIEQADNLARYRR